MDPDIQKLISNTGIAQSGSYGRVPSGIVDLRTGTMVYTNSGGLVANPSPAPNTSTPGGQVYTPPPATQKPAISSMLYQSAREQIAQGSMTPQAALADLQRLIDQGYASGAVDKNTLFAPLDNIKQGSDIFSFSNDFSGSLIKKSATVQQSVVKPGSQSTTSGFQYTVQSGDNLSKIAAQYGVGISDITGYRSGNPNLIYPGEVLTVNKAGSGAAPAKPSNQNYYDSSGYYHTPGTNGVPATKPTPSGSTGNTTGSTGGMDQAALMKMIEEIDKGANADASSEAQKLLDSNFKVDTRRSSDVASRLIGLLEDTAKNAPTAPDLMAELNKKRAELGVGVLEDSLASADTKIAKLDADYSSTLQEEELRPVSMAQIQRHQSADDIAYQRARRDLVAERDGVANQLNMKYGVINTMMSLTGKQYEYAQDEYQAKYNKAVSLVNLFRDIQQDQLTADERKIDNARANLSVIQDLLKSGNISYDKLPDSSKLDIKNMEIQAGLPVGFTKFVHGTVEGQTVSFLSAFTDASGNRIQPVAVKGANGAYEIKNIQLGVTNENESKLLSPDKIANLAQRGVPEVVSKDIQAALNAGYDLETIRRHLASQFGQDSGYRYLDIFMATVQGE